MSDDADGIDNTQPGAVLAQKFWDGGIAPSVPSSLSPLLHSPAYMKFVGWDGV